MAKKFWIIAKNEDDGRLTSLPGVNNEQVLIASKEKPSEYIYPVQKKILTVETLDALLEFIEAAESAYGRPITISASSDNRIEPSLPTIHINLYY